MAVSLREKFGREVRDARLRAGLSQTELSRLTKKGQTYISQIEQGRVNVTVDTILLVSRAVGLEVDLVTRPISKSRTDGPTRAK